MVIRAFSNPRSRLEFAPANCAGRAYLVLFDAFAPTVEHRELRPNNRIG